MKKCWILILLSFVFFDAMAQSIVYHSLKDFINGVGDTIESPARIKIEKRTKNQLMLTGGADYKISSNRKNLDKRLRSSFIVQKADELYVNCKRLRFNKFRFGNCYASALFVNKVLYFEAVPVGAAAISVAGDEPIGMGAIGDAIAASSLTSVRVYYEINMQTGKVDFVGKEKMLSLLENHPELQVAFLKEESEEACVIRKYLLLLKN